MKTNVSCYKNFHFGLAKAILLPFMLLAMFVSSANAQDYFINRGNFPLAGANVYGYNLCVVDKNEYYQTYKTSELATDIPISVRRYKNGIVSDWGTNTSFVNTGQTQFGGSDIVRDSANQVVYIAFFNTAYDKIYTYKRAPADNDWVLVNYLDKPSTNSIGRTLHLAFNKNSGTLFLSFSEQTSNKIYLYELVSGSWTNRTGSSSMSCQPYDFDMVANGNKVIISSTPMVSLRWYLRVHSWDITTNTLTNFPDWNNGLDSKMIRFPTTAYNSATNEYVSLVASTDRLGSLRPVVLKSAGGAAWVDMSTGLSSETIASGSHGCHIVYNNLTAKYTLVLVDWDDQNLKGYYWNGTTWKFILAISLSSSNTFATTNYKDDYFLAIDVNSVVGIYSTNETPIRNTMNIVANPSTTSCILTFPDRGVGNKVAVFIKSGSYVAPVTTDATTYTANTIFGSGTQLGTSGWFCVYNGGGQAVTVTGLTGNTTYQVQALEYNGATVSPLSQMYIGNTSVTGNPVSFVTPPLAFTKTVGYTGADYATLKAAFDAINNGTLQGAITLQIINNTTETATAFLYASGTGASNYTSVSIYPTVTGKTISGAIDGALITLDGADHVTIDGRLNGTGSAVDLTLLNSTQNVITLRNGATYNNIKYCNLKGSDVGSYNNGVISFAPRANNSNSYNIIEYNNITNGGARPKMGIHSKGMATSVNAENIIRFNNIYDFADPSSNATSHGIFCEDYNSGWTIQGNSFYETTALNVTAPYGSTFVFINVTLNNENFVISGNYMGGTAPLCGGTALTKSGGKRMDLYGIVLSNNGTGTTEIQGNILQNIAWSSTVNSTMKGITINSAGNCNIGTTTGNTIGSATGNNSIVLTNGEQAEFMGISLAGSGTTDCANNIIGAIQTANTNSLYANNFKGIYISSSATTSVRNNIIGSTDAGTSNSINASSASSSNNQFVVGIESNPSNGTNVTISGNTISKMVNATTNNYGLTSGIRLIRGTNTVTNNSVHDLVVGNCYNEVDNAGICLNFAATTAQTITGNTIYNISNPNSGFTKGIIGIFYSGGTIASTVSGNFIHSISVNASSDGASIYGIKIAEGTTTYSNNIISLGGNTKTTIYGIYERGVSSTTNTNLYFNTVYISGAPTSGSYQSYALWSYNYGNTRNFRNNVLYNARSNSGASGNHYALYFSSVGSAGLTEDYNNYYVSGDGGMLGYSSFNRSTLASLQSATGQDVHSLNTNPSFVSAGGINATDYKTNTVLPAVSGTGITTDYSSVGRASVPTMGAFEFKPVTTEAVSSIANSTATGNGAIIATGTFTGRGCIVYEYSDTDKIIGDGGVQNFAETGSFSTGAFTANLTGLLGNTRYNARAHATLSGINFYGNRVDFYTLANVPSAPVISNQGSTTMYLTVSANGNSAATEFAIQDSVNGTYLQANGTRGADTLWQTAADWATITVTGLTSGNTYYFRVKARNINNVETDFGPSATGTTGEKPTVAWQPGSLWSETQPTGDTDKNWQSVSLSSNGAIQLAAIFNGRMYKSVDGGTSWTETQPAGDVVKNWNAVAVSLDGTTMLASISGSGRLYKSVNGGNNWSEAQPAGDVFKDWASVALSATGDTMLVAVSGGRVYISNDAGTNWNETTPSGAAENKNWRAVSISANGLTMLAGGGTGFLYKSTDGGTNWSQASLSETFWKTVSVSSDGQTMLAGVYDGRLYKSTNSGTTWSETTPTGTTEDKLWQSVSVSADGLTMLAAITQGGRLYKSVDGGNSWSETQPAGDENKNWSSVAVSSDASMMLASVYSGRLYHSTLAIFTGITTTSASATGKITATNSANATNRGAIIYPYTNTDKVIGGTDVTNVSNDGNFGAGAYPVSFTGLTPGARYNARAHATSIYGTGYSDRGDFWTLANVPDAPTVNNPTATTLDVSVNANGNASLTQFAIYETSAIMYLQADGTLGATAVWKTATEWGAKTVTALTTGTEYTFQVKARNGDNIETAFGPTASGTPVDHPFVAWQLADVWSEMQPVGNVNKTWPYVSQSSNGMIKLAAPSDGRLYLSVDGGTTWSETQPAGNVNKVWDCISVSGNGSTMIAGSSGGSRLYLSTNNGVSWTETQPVGNVDKLWKACSVSYDGSTMLACVNNGRLYLSVNGGGTWVETQPAGNVDRWWSVVSVSGDGLTMMAGGNTGRLYISTNQGGSWNQTQPEGDADKKWHSISISDNGSIMLAVNRTSGSGEKIYKSVNAGGVWAETQFAGSPDWNSVSMSGDGLTLLAAPGYGSLYRSVNGGTSWIIANPTGIPPNNFWKIVSVSGNGLSILAGQFDGRLYNATSAISTDITSTTASATGNITAINNANATNRGAIIYPYTDTDKIIGGTDVTNVSNPGDFGIGTYPVSFTGLTPNTRYNARAHATNIYGTGYSARADFRTLANVPAAPTINNPTATTLDVAVNVNSNP
ncbi:MAG: hypothetical protein WCP32_11655, partial [Bacteroidota bacterium]